MPTYAIFSRQKRTARHGKSASEQPFAYLDTSARAVAVKVRRLVESYFSRLPASERTDWLKRFKSPDASAHHAAFFELLLHEWLLRQGFSVQHHPTVPGTTKHPDFFATHTDGREFYLEATSTDGQSDDEAREERFVDLIIAEIGKVISASFFVDIHFLRRPLSQPALGKLKRDIETWLIALDYDTVKLNRDGFARRYSVGGGEILLVPSAKYRRKKTSVLAAMMRRGAQTIDTQGTLLPALRKKAGRYGQLDKPYVIAVNDLSEFFHEHHAIESMLGREAVVTTNTGKRWVEFDGSGLVGSASNPKYTRVSAALIVPGVTPFNFAKRVPVFVSNPMARRPVGQLMGPCSGYFMRDQKFVQSKDDPSLGDILNLAAGWPG